MESNNTPQSKSKKGILIAEDEAPIRNFLTDLLINNYQIFVASDGLEVKNCFRYFGNRINLVITDWQLPNTDEEELVFWLRKQNESLPILLITGHEGKSNLERLLSLELVRKVSSRFKSFKKNTYHSYLHHRNTCFG